MMGWLADQNQTLYIRRAERRNSHGQAAAIATALNDPQPLTLFPEGTTGDGNALLPFRSTLFDAVAPPPPGVVVRPVAIDYGAARNIFAWPRPETGKANALRILGHRGPTPVIVRLLDPLPPSSDRKAIAQLARSAIAAALAASNPARPTL